MRLATLRTPSGTRAVRVEDDVLVDLGCADLGEFLATGGRPDGVERAGGLGRLVNRVAKEQP